MRASKPPPALPQALPLALTSGIQRAHACTSFAGPRPSTVVITANDARTATKRHNAQRNITRRVEVSVQATIPWYHHTTMVASRRSCRNGSVHEVLLRPARQRLLLQVSMRLPCRRRLHCHNRYCDVPLVGNAPPLSGRHSKEASRTIDDRLRILRTAILLLWQRITIHLKPETRYQNVLDSHGNEHHC